MGERAKIIINEYTALEILHRPDFDINRFYSSDYRIFITALLKENERLKKRENELQEKFKDWKKEIEKEKKYYLCERTDCCRRIKDSKKYSSIYCELKDYKSRNEKAIDIAYEYGQIDGEHHKTWCIDQMLRALADNNYNKFVKEYENNGEYKWNIGIAP